MNVKKSMIKLLVVIMVITTLGISVFVALQQVNRLQDTRDARRIAGLTANNFVTLNGQNFTVNGSVITPYGSTMYPHWCVKPTIGTIANNNNFGTCTSYIHGSGWARPDFTNYIDYIIALAQQFHATVIRPTNFFDGVTFGDWQNATVWANMDYLFQQAAAHNMHVLLDLSSFRDILVKNTVYAYDPTNSAYQNFTWVAQRYAANPTLLNYAIAGEVPCPNGTDPTRPASTQALIDYYHTLSDRLHAVDPNHLISTGGLSHVNQSFSSCGIDWQTIFSLPNINIAAIHVYSDNDRNITMPMVSGWANNNNKPFTVEEFGFRQNLGDSTRAASYQNMYNLATKYHATSIIFWNIGDETASTSYEVGPATTPLTWNIVVQNAP